MSAALMRRRQSGVRTSGGEGGAAGRGVRGKVLGGRGGRERGRIFVEGNEKLFKRGIFVAMGEGARPDAKLFHVVAHGRNLAGVRAGGFLEIGDDLLNRAKRNEVAKNFLARDEGNGLAVIFRDVVGEELVGLKAGRGKMNVV